MCRVPRLSDQRLRFFALSVEFYAQRVSTGQRIEFRISQLTGSQVL